tara:strand:+ start:880 stop:1395 length:516 start_codon:yes stop_codon:yes gene_type:complete
MKLRHFHILLILLFALFLCPLLGGYCGPEGLHNIEEHLENEHGVHVGGSSGVNRRQETLDQENTALEERLDNIEKKISERQDNREQVREQVQENRQEVIDNVGGNLRGLGALENNQIPPHKHMDEEKCPPCPPCARCPEDAFKCKKVPNYEAKTPEGLPRAVLSDFSSFGM